MGTQAALVGPRTLCSSVPFAVSNAGATAGHPNQAADSLLGCRSFAGTSLAAHSLPPSHQQQLCSAMAPPASFRPPSVVSTCRTHSVGAHCSRCLRRTCSPQSGTSGCAGPSGMTALKRWSTLSQSTCMPSLWLAGRAHRHTHAHLPHRLLAGRHSHSRLSGVLRLRHRLCLVFPLPSQLRHRLYLVCSTAFATKTPPLPRGASGQIVPFT